MSQLRRNDAGHVIADHAHIEANLQLHKVGAGVAFSDEIFGRPVCVRIKYLSVSPDKKIRHECSVFGLLQTLYVGHKFQRGCVEDVAHPVFLATRDLFAAHHQDAAHSERSCAKKIFLQRDAISIAAVHVNDRIYALLYQYCRSGCARHMHLGGISQLHGIDRRAQDLALPVQRFCVRCLRQVHMGSHHEIFRSQGIFKCHAEFLEIPVFIISNSLPCRPYASTRRHAAAICRARC